MFAEDLLEVEEFVLLYGAFAPRPNNPAFPYWKYKHLNIDELTKEECMSEFRFKKEDLPPLLHALNVPAKLTCR